MSATVRNGLPLRDQKRLIKDLDAALRAVRTVQGLARRDYPTQSLDDQTKRENHARHFGDMYHCLQATQLFEARILAEMENEQWPN